MTNLTAPAKHLRNVFGHFPTGVAVISGHGPDGPTGLTIQSFLALSLDPALILIAIDRNSQSWPNISGGPGFVVNVLCQQQRDIAMRFATSGGPKFDGVSWTPAPHTGAPRLVGAQAWIECKVSRTYDGGDHHIIVAAVHDLQGTTDTFSQPLLFFRSKFPQIDVDHWNAHCR
jgi:3-hydroxy-9,10-secoandrosta-1,3,5(10)-triene-9,17-dione monooxygenase reductase component